MSRACERRSDADRRRRFTAAILVITAIGASAGMAACSSSSSPSAPTTRATPPSTANFSGTVPSQLASALESGQSAASAAASSAQAAASAFEASVSAESGRSAAAAKAALASVSGSGNAVADVQLTGLPKARTGGLNAVIVNITNSTGQQASYAVKVNFADTTGAVVDSVVVGTENLAPGGKAQPIAFSTKSEDKTLIPTVAQAQRY